METGLELLLNLPWDRACFSLFPFSVFYFQFLSVR